MRKGQMLHFSRAHSLACDLWGIIERRRHNHVHGSIFFGAYKTPTGSGSWCAGSKFNIDISDGSPQRVFRLVKEADVPDEIWAELAKWRLINAD